MPSIASVVKRFAKQTLVYWKKKGTNASGRPTYEDPVEVKCRWEGTTRQVMTPASKIVIATGRLLLVSEVTADSIVMKGTIEDWKKLKSYPNPPTAAEGGREVLTSLDTPDLNAKGHVYEAYV